MMVTCDACGALRPVTDMTPIPPNPLCVEWMCKPGAITGPTR